MTQLYLRSRSVLLLCFSSLSLSTLAQSLTGAKHETHPSTCVVDRTPPTAADTALAKTDYADAESLYRKQLSADSASPTASLGLVRSLIGEDRVAEARTQANKFLSEHPKESIAEVALGEVEFRDAHFSDARTS